MRFDVLFHGDSSLKCAEVVQPQMINLAKYGNLSSSNFHGGTSTCFAHSGDLGRAYIVVVVVEPKHIMSMCKFEYIILYIEVFNYGVFQKLQNGWESG